MTDQFVAEIRIFPFNFAPKGWALCNGQLLPISQNTALFSLLGNDLRRRRAGPPSRLPDLQGRAPMHPGQGPGLSPVRPRRDRRLRDGHAPPVRDPGAHPRPQGQPADRRYAGARRQRGVARPGTINAFQTATASNLAPMASESLPAAGGGQPHNNLQPYLTVHFCIALQGIFPPRS